VKTFPTRKDSIRSGGFKYKSKGGIGSARSDQEITDLLEEGKKHWEEITIAGVKTACFNELTVTWKGD